MSERSFRFTKRSKVSSSNLQNKVKYRVVYKSRSGILDDVSSVSSRSLSHVNAKMNVTNSSFIEERRHSHSRTLSDLEPKMSATSDVGNFIKDETEKPLKVELPPITQSLPELQEQNLDEMSISQVQKKVDALIELKLQKVASKIDDNQVQNERIDKEMDKILNYLQKQETGEVNLETTNKKIEILEKIIAERVIESEMAKKYYFKKINNRKEKIPNISQFKVNVNELKEQTRKLMQRNPPTSIHFESTCQINYKAPNKNDYPLANPKPKYIFDNQPLPRSSYGCDYLAYRNLPKYKHEQSSSQLMPSCSMGKRNSSYQEDFTVKKIEKINFKELDCYQDKFRNLKIPLIHSSSRPFEEANSTSVEPKNYKTIENPEQKLIKAVRFKTQNSHFIHGLQTENQMNFRGQNNNIKSSIKHKKLNNLKYTYKAIVHA